MDWKLEVVVVPVSDVDRAKHFYSEQVGFNVDTDMQMGEHLPCRPAHPAGLRVLDHDRHRAR